MHAGAEARWRLGKSKRRHKLPFVPAALRIGGRALGKAVLGVHNRGQGVRGLTSVQRGHGGSIFTFLGFQCRLKKEVDYYQTEFLFRPFVRLYSTEQGQTSALERFFFFFLLMVLLDLPMHSLIS